MPLGVIGREAIHFSDDDSVLGADEAPAHSVHTTESNTARARRLADFIDLAANHNFPPVVRNTNQVAGGFSSNHANAQQNASVQTESESHSRESYGKTMFTSFRCI